MENMCLPGDFALKVKCITCKKSISLKKEATKPHEKNAILSLTDTRLCPYSTHTLPSTCNK